MPKLLTILSCWLTRTSSWRTGSSRCTSNPSWRTKRSLTFREGTLTMRSGSYFFSSRAKTTNCSRRCSRRMESIKLILRTWWCRSPVRIWIVRTSVPLAVLDSHLVSETSTTSKSTSQSEVEAAKLLLTGQARPWISANSWRIRTTPQTRKGTKQWSRPWTRATDSGVCPRRQPSCPRRTTRSKTWCRIYQGSELVPVGSRGSRSGLRCAHNEPVTWTRWRPWRWKEVR